MPSGPELQDGWLTQFGTDYFREQPRYEMEFDVSALLGKLTLVQTVYAIFGRKPHSGHTNRYFAIPKLVEASYRCLHTGRVRNPQHASILAGCPDDDMEAHKSWWSDPRRIALSLLAESEV